MKNKTAVNTRKKVDHGIQKYLLTGVAATSVAIIFLIILFIFIESTEAISAIGPWEFISGTEWRPFNGSFGAFPIILGTILTTIGALIFAVPLGITSAIFLSEIASERTRNILKPVCEVFAGIPSIVYGFFGLMVIVPFIFNTFPNLAPAGFSWLAASILLGIMALPTIVSVSDDAMRSVPKSHREASVALGATHWETTRKVVIPAAFSGISAAVMLGMGRAIGETMAVVMVAGNAPNIPEPMWNVFEMIRTITSTLAKEVGEVTGLHLSALFLLALVLMAMLLLTNLTANLIMRNTKRKFETGQGMIEKHLPDNVKNVINMAKRPVMLSMAFVVVMMMASLFTDIIVSTLIAFACILFISTMPFISKRIRSLNRQRIAHLAMSASMIVVCAILFILIADITVKGIPALSWEFLTDVPRDMGRAGGILPAIVGTVQLIIGTALIALPLGILTGIYLAEFAKDNRFTKIVRSSIDILNGTPSIVFGLFGFALFVHYLGIGRTLIGGCIVLAFLILPVIIRTTEETVKAVPQELREASAAMGATKWETTAKVIVPAAMGGVVTGVILSLGRAAGETAPIMFVAAVGIKRHIEFSLFDTIMALPYYLYYLTEVPNSEEVRYGVALVLLMIVLSMFAIASMVRHHYSKKVRW
ncbi:MAG: phosphate ABC transporter permease subunit PstC [Methanomassiliicoccaceae archaeon]|nr:phosphate ABC transporter permease subunit PstC [Methanomassiliicoccaceae archaeon]